MLERGNSCPRGVQTLPYRVLKLALISCLWALLRAVTSCKMASSSVPTVTTNTVHEQSSLCHRIRCMQHKLHNNGPSLSRWIHIYIYSNHIITACSLGQQMCLLTVTHLKLLCSRGYESLLSVRCSTQTAGISTLKRNSPKQALPTACMNKHDQLTQAFHGLVQNLCVRTGTEICAGFYGSSVGLQHGRCAQRKLFFALFFQSQSLFD